MEAMEPVVAQPVAQETVTIPPGHNTLVVRVREHTWASVSTAEREIVRERSPNPIVGFSVSPGNYTVRTDGKIESITSEAIQPVPSLWERFKQESPAILRLTSDAPDRHVVDGIGEIPANGTSFCTITVAKVALEGTPLIGKEHQDEVFLRTTGGVLMDEKGKKHIRSLKLKSGQASFRLVSESSPKVVTVSAFGRVPFLSKAEIQIEFV